MKFSTKAEYGLRALVHLDKRAKEPVSLGLIAQQEKLSLPYLERIFARLKKAGVVRSLKGSKGGYVLARPAKQIKAAEIIRALEGELYRWSCPKCHLTACRVHPVWRELYKQINKTLSAISLDSLMS